MNAFEISSRDVALLRHEANRQQQQQHVGSTSNIKASQIRTGCGLLEETPEYWMSETLAEKLNCPPNPERNGLVLLWAYNFYRLMEGDVQAISKIINLLVEGGGGRGEGKEDHRLNLPAECPRGIDRDRYRELQVFLTRGLNPSLTRFQDKTGARHLNCSVLAINLWKAIEEIRKVLSS